jgi:hypothetical protein
MQWFCRTERFIHPLSYWCSFMHPSRIPRSKFTHRKIATRKRYVVLSISFCSVQYTCIKSILRTYRTKYMNSESYCVLGCDTTKPSKTLQPFQPYCLHLQDSRRRQLGPPTVCKFWQTTRRHIQRDIFIDLSWDRQIFRDGRHRIWLFQIQAQDQNWDTQQNCAAA